MGIHDIPYFRIRLITKLVQSSDVPNLGPYFSQVGESGGIVGQKCTCFAFYCCSYRCGCEPIFATLQFNPAKRIEKAMREVRAMQVSTSCTHGCQSTWTRLLCPSIRFRFISNVHQIKLTISSVSHPQKSHCRRMILLNLLR